MAKADATVTLSERPSSVALLTLGGAAAAFAAASCCGLPLLLATLGIGSAGLVGIALAAAPYRLLLLAVATAGLAGGGYLLFWRLRPAACGPGSLCARPLFRATMAAGLIVGLALLYLGYAYV